MKRKKRILFGIVCLIGIAVGIIMLVRWNELIQYRELSRQEASRHDLQGIMLDLSNLSEMNGRLPAVVKKDRNGQPMYSWRFQTAALLLGDAVQDGYYGQCANLDKRWDDPENRRYNSGPYREYMGCPLNYIDSSRPGNKAHFVAIVGPDTGFDESKPHQMSDLPASLIIVVEATGCQFHWMEPGGDLDIRTMPRQIGVEGGIGPVSKEQKLFLVGFADGCICTLRNDIPFEELAKLFTITNAKLYDRGQFLGPYIVWKNY